MVTSSKEEKLDRLLYDIALDLDIEDPPEGMEDRVLGSILNEGDKPSKFGLHKNRKLWILLGSAACAAMVIPFANDLFDSTHKVNHVAQKEVHNRQDPQDPENPQDPINQQDPKDPQDHQNHQNNELASAFGDVQKTFHLKSPEKTISGKVYLTVSPRGKELVIVVDGMKQKRNKVYQVWVKTETEDNKGTNKEPKAEPIGKVIAKTKLYDKPKQVIRKGKHISRHIVRKIIPIGVIEPSRDGRALFATAINDEERALEVFVTVEDSFKKAHKGYKTLASDSAKAKRNKLKRKALVDTKPETENPETENPQTALQGDSAPTEGTGNNNNQDTSAASSQPQTEKQPSGGETLSSESSGEKQSDVTSSPNEPSEDQSLLDIVDTVENVVDSVVDSITK
jgi:hypothetical protein